MSNFRLASCFSALKTEGRAGFIAYMMGGDPDQSTSLEILKRLPAAGVDIIEVGFPFSDPMADGPAVQASAIRALSSGGSLQKTLDLIAKFRRENQVTPVVLMGYTNPLLSLGYEVFAHRAAEASVDGLIVVDLPPEEAGPLADALERHQIALIRLTTPTTDVHRAKVIAERASGFIYHVSVAGVTGVKEADEVAVAPLVKALRDATGQPIAVGFGVKTPELAAAIARIADAVVVGSALVEEIAIGLAKDEPVKERVLAKVTCMASAIKSVAVASG